VSVGLAAYGHYESFYIWIEREQALIWIVAICTAISIFYLLAYLASTAIAKNLGNRIIVSTENTLVWSQFIIFHICKGQIELSFVELGRHFSWSSCNFVGGGG